jgi:hypothetical protein
LNWQGGRATLISANRGRLGPGRKAKSEETFDYMPRRLFEIVLALMLSHIAATLAGCGTFAPPRVEDPAFERHAVTREKSNVT